MHEQDNIGIKHKQQMTIDKRAAQTENIPIVCFINQANHSRGACSELNATLTKEP